MNHFQKRTKKVEKLRVLFFQFGLIVSCTFTFLAFEWTSSYSVKQLKGIPIIDDGITEIPPITFSTPEKPQPKIQQTSRVSTTMFKVVPNTVETPIDEPTDPIIEPVDFKADWMPVEPTETTDELFIIVEDMPEFVGGEIEMFKFLGKSTVYPEVERKMGNQGTVWVSFTIDKQGKIKDAHIKRGVSKYLDQEALRVVKSMPDWIPGKQRGKAVNVSYNLPIKFILKN